MCVREGMTRWAAAIVVASARALLSPGPTHWCCKRTLKVGRYSGSAEPWLYASAAGIDASTGFLPEVEYMLLNEMGVTYEFVDVGSTANYLENMLNAVADGSVDVMFEGPLSFPIAGYKLSLPFYEIADTVVVRKERERLGSWGLFAPFEMKLWVAIVVAIVAGGLVVAALEPLSAYSRARPILGRAETVVQAQYHAWALLLSGDERDWATWPQRVFRVGFLALSLVVIATYTANLAAFLSAASYELSGPSKVSEMDQHSTCVLYEFWMPGYAEYIDVDDARYPEMDPAIDAATATYGDRVDYCVDLLKDGDVDAVILNKATAWGEVLDDCEGLEMITTVDIPGAASFGVFAADADDDFIFNVSMTIRHMVSSKAYVKVRDDMFRFSESCPATDDLVPIALDSMVGLFVIYAASAGLAILLRALNLRKKDVDAAADDDEADVRDAWVEEDAKVHDVSPSDAGGLSPVGGDDDSPSKRKRRAKYKRKWKAETAPADPAPSDDPFSCGLYC